MYVAINYLASMDIIVSVADSLSDTFTYVGGEYGSSQSVAFYQVAVEHGGSAKITVTIDTSEFGTCRAGQLSAGTTAGVIGPGGNSNSATDTTLTLTNSATHAPSLLLALFGSTRPSGAWWLPSPVGAWMMGGQEATGGNPGTESALYGYNATTAGSVVFAEVLGDSGNGAIYLSGIVVEFYVLSPPVTGCFGSGSCSSQGTTCQDAISETQGDFMYVAINYLASSDIISSVSDSQSDPFTYFAGEFGPSQSVAFYDVTYEHGGASTITVTLSTAEYGSCRVGQLSANTAVGTVGAGGNTNSDTDTTLSVTDTQAQTPSLLLALFGSTRPSGAWSLTTPAGAWMTGGQEATGSNPGTESALYAFTAITSGTVTFTERLNNSGYNAIFLSGIAVEFYVAPHYYTTDVGWPGWNGPNGTIYLTDAQVSTGISGPNASAFQAQSVEGIQNSISVGVTNATDLAASYYVYETGCSCIRVWTTFASASNSQLYDEGLWNWFTQAVQMYASISGMPTSTTLQIQFDLDAGPNVTEGGQSNWATNWFSVDSGVMAAVLAVAAPLCPETFGLTCLAAGIMATAFSVAGSFNNGGDQGTTNGATTEAGGSDVQWFETENGDLVYCTVPYSSCSFGHNSFGATEQILFSIPGPFTGGATGTISLGAFNQLTDGECAYPSQNCGSTYRGAQATANIGLEPAYGIGGQVTTSAGGVAPGGIVSVSATTFSSGAYYTTYYVEPVNATTGDWHFFGEPGETYTTYVYQATCDGTSSQLYFIPPADMAEGGDTEGLDAVL